MPVGIKRRTSREIPSRPPPGRGIEKRSPQNSEQIKLMILERVATIGYLSLFFEKELYFFKLIMPLYSKSLM